MRSTFFSLLLSPALFFYGNAAIAQQSNKPGTPVPKHLEDSSAATQASKGGTPQAFPEMQSSDQSAFGRVVAQREMGTRRFDAEWPG